MPSVRRAGLLAALAASPVALAYRFALVYRRRAGYPARRPPMFTPADVGLAYESITVESSGGPLAGWFVPARDGEPGPGVVLVHGWESNRARVLPNAEFLVAAGFHCLLFDVRGHGENPADPLPISAGEFGADAEAAVGTLLDRPEVTSAGLLGHSMGGAGAILAAAAEPRVAALVSTSAPSDPRLLTRHTFRLAGLPIPDLIAHPLAWLTTRVYLRPRGHSVAAISGRRAITRYRGPILLVHGAQDEVVPFADLGRLERAAQRSRTPSDPPVKTLALADGLHRWLYETPEYRATIARFLAEWLGGPYSPDEAAQRSIATAVVRPPDTEGPFAAVPVRRWPAIPIGRASPTAGGSATREPGPADPIATEPAG